MNTKRIPRWLGWTWLFARIIIVFCGLSAGVTPGLVLFLILFPDGLKHMFS